MTPNPSQTTSEPLPPVPGSALADYTPPPKYRRWECAFTAETWALPLCFTMNIPNDDDGVLAVLKNWQEATALKDRLESTLRRKSRR